MDSLITRLLHVPHMLKDENLADAVETSAMVAPCGRGGDRNSRGGRGGRSGVLIAPIARGWVTLKKTVTYYMAFLKK